MPGWPSHFKALSMSIIINILLVGGLLWWVKRLYVNSQIAWAYWPAAILKIFCGLGIGWLYTYYYSGGDTYTIFYLAEEFAAEALHNSGAYIANFFTIETWIGWGNYSGPDRTVVVSRWVSLLVLLTNGNYWLVAVWCSVLSFLGLFYLATKFGKCFTGTAYAAAIALLFWPSVTFWSSGLLKEALGMGALGLALGGILSLIYGKRLSGFQFVFSLLSVLFLWRIKFFVAVPLLVAGFALMIGNLVNGKNKLAVLAGLALLLFLGYWLSLSHPYLQAPYALKALVENYNYYPEAAQAGSYLKLNSLKPDWLSFLMGSPKYLAGGMYMPLPFIPYRLYSLQLLLGIENVVWLLLSALALVKFFKKRYVNHNLAVIIALAYSGLLAVAMAVASPVFGSLVRYRVYYLPLVIFIVLAYLFPDYQLKKLLKVRTFAALWKTR